MASIKGKWVFNETISYTGATIDVDVNFISNGVSYKGIYIDYHGSEYIAYITPQGNYDIVYHFFGVGWTNEAVRTVDFGSSVQDISDSLSIFMETYATPEAEPTSTPTTITYNGSTIASLFGGQTATLKCGGMKMETDLVVEVAEPDPVLQEKTATENGEVTPDEGYDGLSKVTVNVPETIPDGYIRPSGTKSVTANGVHDVGSFANVNVSVPVGVFPSGTKEITENGTHDVTEFASVEVNVPAPVLTYYDGSVTISGGVELISFSVDGDPYEAEDGMTWEQWVNSSYNTDGYIIQSGYILTGNKNYYVKYNGSFVRNTDIINDSYAYSWYMESG